MEKEETLTLDEMLEKLSKDCDQLTKEIASTMANKSFSSEVSENLVLKKLNSLEERVKVLEEKIAA